MSSDQTSQENGESSEPKEYGFGDYDTNIVTLSDTETDGVPTEEILDRYDESDVDAFVYNGDASKKMDNGWNDPEDYLKQFEDTYEHLSNIKEELGAEVLVQPGNHSPIPGVHTPRDITAEKDSEYVKEVESFLSEEYEEFSNSEKNAYEFLVDEYDLTNIEYDSVDLGDLTVVGGTHSDGEMDKLLEKDWLDETPDLEELGYSEEELEKLAGDISSSGGILSKILSVITLGFYGGRSDVDPEDVGLGDIPEDYDEMTENHEAYGEASELLEYFEGAIEEADNDVLIAHHSAPSSTGDKFNSKVTEYLAEAEEYSGDIAGVTGGHSGNAGILEGDNVTKVNTNGGAIAELGYKDGELIAEDMYNVTSQEPSESGEDINKAVQKVAEMAPVEEKEAAQLVQRAVNQGIPAEEAPQVIMEAMQSQQQQDAQESSEEPSESETAEEEPPEAPA